MFVYFLISLMNVDSDEQNKGALLYSIKLLFEQKKNVFTNICTVYKRIRMALVFAKCLQSQLSFDF